jgi:hypothetical protein
MWDFLIENSRRSSASDLLHEDDRLDPGVNYNSKISTGFSSNQAT